MTPHRLRALRSLFLVNYLHQRRVDAAPSTLDLSMCEWWDGTPCVDSRPPLKRALRVAELEQDLKRAINRDYTP